MHKITVLQNKFSSGDMVIPITSAYATVRKENGFSDIIRWDDEDPPGMVIRYRNTEVMIVLTGNGNLVEVDDYQFREIHSFITQPR